MPRKKEEQPIEPEILITSQENSPTEALNGDVVTVVPEQAITDLALNSEEQLRESERQIEAMMESQVKNKDKMWIVEMIEREATPARMRLETAVDFCKRHGITENVYQYYARKPEYRKKMIKLAIEKVKEHTAEIMDNLAERAKNDNKASELFLDYVLELSKNLDIRTAPTVAALTPEQKQNLNKLLLNEPDEQEKSTSSA